jgi:hypothetical protein
MTSEEFDAVMELVTVASRTVVEQLFADCRYTKEQKVIILTELAFQISGYKDALINKFN